MDWFPDWRGQTAVVLGCGPSASQVQAERVRGKAKVIAVNRAWEKAPWADALYACDPKWWQFEGKGYGQHALREFPGLKVGQRNEKNAFTGTPDGLHLVRLEYENRLITEPGVIGSCLNGGFQAINLVYHFGCRRILLLGFDMHGEKGLHYHGDHPSPMGNPNQTTWNRWIGAFHDAEQSIRDVGVEVINCTPGSALKLFPMMDVEEALGDVGLR